MTTYYEDPYRTEYDLCMEEAMREKSDRLIDQQERLSELRELRHRKYGRIIDSEYKSQREAILSWCMYYRRPETPMNCASCNTRPATHDSYGYPACGLCAARDLYYWLGDLLHAFSLSSEKGA